VNWIALAALSSGAGFCYWLGLRDARSRISSRSAGARATGILLFVGIASAVLAGWYGVVGVALSMVYLLGWFREGPQSAGAR
jgi:hypothetical protein